MFIEELEKNKRHLEEFAKAFKCSLEKYEMTEDGLYVSLFNGSYGPQPEFWINDFRIQASYYYRDFEDIVQKYFINLFKKLFPNYVDEYKAHYDNKIEGI